MTVLALLLLPSQRATVPSSWIAEPTVSLVADFGAAVLFPHYLVGVMIVGWLGYLLWPVPTTATPGDTARRLGGVSCLLLIVPVLIGFSYLVQPVQQPRYGITAVLGLAPAVAWLISKTPWQGLLVLGLFLLLFSTKDVASKAARHRALDQQVREQIDKAGEFTDAEFILFDVAHMLFPVCHYAPKELASRCYYNVPHEHTKVFQRYYGQPAVTTWQEVSGSKHVYWLPGFGKHREPLIRQNPNPDWEAHHQGNGFYRLVPRSPGK